MNFKVLYFTFPKPLTEEQNECFIAAIQAIAKESIRRLKHAASVLKLPWLSKDGKIVQARLNAAADNFNTFVRLHHIQPTVYAFKINAEFFSFLDKKVPLVGKITYWERFLKRTKDFVEKDVAKDMGLKRGEIAYTQGEVVEET